jgi:hypothetical protein
MVDTDESTEPYFTWFNADFLYEGLRATPCTFFNRIVGGVSQSPALPW